MSARKSSHRTIFLIVSSGSPLALIASSLCSTSKKPVCPMTRSLHPPMAHCRQRVRFAATWREEFFEVPSCRREDQEMQTLCSRPFAVASLAIGALTLSALQTQGADFTQTNLVSDIPGLAKITDPQLVNP